MEKEKYTKIKPTSESVITDEDLSARMILDLIGEGIFICDPRAGAILQINKPLTDMFACLPEYFCNLDPGELSATTGLSTPQGFREKIQEAAIRQVPAFKWQCLKPNGEIFHVQVALHRLPKAGQSLILTVLQDISRLETAENMLSRARPLETIGELSASIAHEIRQPLQVIKIITDSILYWHDEKNMSLETLIRNIGHLKKVSSAAHRIDELITNIQQMVRDSRSTELHPLNINQAIEGIIQIYIQRLLNHGICLKLDLDPGVSAIDFPLLKFQQVFINLLNNALQAHDKSGGREKKLTITTREAADRLTMLVADNAGGIKAELIEHIFEPLASTNTYHDSLGMGLYIARKIMQSHNSQLSVANNDLLGATFTLEFIRKDYILLETGCKEQL